MFARLRNTVRVLLGAGTPREDDWWRAKQGYAKPGRYYGDGGTIHATRHLDVETHLGDVVAVWFRCRTLPFVQHEVDAARADAMRGSGATAPALTGVEVVDGG